MLFLIAMPRLPLVRKNFPWVARFSFLIGLTIIFGGAWYVPKEETVKIEIWYGHQQRFGHLGQPQRWVNILGKVRGYENVLNLVYRLNHSADTPLSMGSDLHRLAKPGDFNVELSWDSLQVGKNLLTITANHNGGQATEEVMLWVEKGNRWPIPYNVQFDTVTNLQNVVQIVDGLWALESDGVRTSEPYYDRVLTMGDTSWKDFEALVSLTVHGWTPSQPGPPTYNVSHFGVALRWRGHHADGKQPSRKWFPLGAQGEFLLKTNYDSCHWRILHDGGGKKNQTYTTQRNGLDINTKMFVLAQVNSLSDGRTRYRFKQWKAGKNEPKSWDIEGIEEDDYPSGALCLVPHNSDVTLHWVKALEIKN